MASADLRPGMLPAERPFAFYDVEMARTESRVEHL